MGEAGQERQERRGQEVSGWAGGDMLAACACVRLVVARGSDLVHETGEPSTHDGPDPGR